MSPDTPLRSATLTGASEDELRDRLHALHATDGLPVILPTPERVAAMLEVAAFAGWEPDIAVGEVGPNLGLATIEKIAINAVMAGCLPEHLPVVIAGVQALCDPRADTTEAQVTTHQVAPLLIVNGPAVEQAGLAAGFGALGYGHRANLCIGRALRLCLVNLGGVFPGMSDMSLLSQPGSIAYCLAEDEAASPFEPLHVSLGYAPETSVATVVGVGAPASVICRPGTDGNPWTDRLLDVLAATIASVGNNNARGTKGTCVVVLNPDHARALADEGRGRAEIVAELAARAGHPAGHAEWLRHGIGTRDAAGFAPSTRGPEGILLMVAGGPGLYSAVMTPWGGGPHGNGHVSKEIVFHDACEVDLSNLVR